MRMRALQRLGHDVRGVHTVRPWAEASWLQRNLQRRLQRGGIVNAINRAVLEAAREFRPNLVWAEKQEFLHVETLGTLRKLGAQLAHFTPDPYFSLSWKRTSLMDQAMRAFDFLVYCKSYERREYEALATHSIYMPLGYCDEVHRPLPSSDDRWHCAVGFLGGWEHHRQILLHEIAQAGLGLKFWGDNWEFLHDGKWTLRRHLVMRQEAGKSVKFEIRRDPLLASAHQGREVYADDYARALTGCEIGLGFLRKVCPDQHTTRSFEIPACGSMLLADRSDEHRSFFDEGKEAEFFSSTPELLDKAKYYGSHKGARQKIAQAGHDRCIRSEYAYIHRIRRVLMEAGR